MKTKMRLIAGALMVLALSSCTIEREVHFYPVDLKGADSVVLTGRIVGHGQLHGIAEITMPDGEFLQGDYSIVAGGSMSFGSIFGSVYAPGGSASVSGTATNTSISGEGQGQAFLMGNRGTSAQCEFLNNNFMGHGYGACRTSKGAVYRMIY
jgi:hypothetical protein